MADKKRAPHGDCGGAYLELGQNDVFSVSPWRALSVNRVGHTLEGGVESTRPPAVGNERKHMCFGLETVFHTPFASLANYRRACASQYVTHAPFCFRGFQIPAFLHVLTSPKKGHLLVPRPSSLRTAARDACGRVTIGGRATGTLASRASRWSHWR